MINLKHHHYWQIWHCLSIRRQWYHISQVIWLLKMDSWVIYLTSRIKIILIWTGNYLKKIEEQSLKKAFYSYSLVKKQLKSTGEYWKTLYQSKTRMINGFLIFQTRTIRIFWDLSLIRSKIQTTFLSHLRKDKFWKVQKKRENQPKIKEVPLQKRNKNIKTAKIQEIEEILRQKEVCLIVTLIKSN